MLKLLGSSLLLCFVLGGCAGMADSVDRMANRGVIEQEKSTFDGATIVKMSPATLYREGAAFGIVPIHLGARWSSKAQDQVALILSYKSNISSGNSAFMSFSALSTNIDGVIAEYKSGGATAHDSSAYNSVSKTIYTQSSNAVVIPITELRKMLVAKDCRLRIHTSNGYEDVQFSVDRMPDGQATAIVYLREFMKRVEAPAVKEMK